MKRLGDLLAATAVITTSCLAAFLAGYLIGNTHGWEDRGVWEVRR